MVNHLLLWASDSPRLERTITNSKMFGKLVHRFIAGDDLADALSAASDLNSRGIGGITDLLGEGVKDLTGATEASQEYLSAIAAIAEKKLDATVSLKLSQLGLILDPATCASNLAMILDRAQELGVGVEIDMEQSELVDATLKVFREAAEQHPETRLAIQANLRRTPSDLDAMAALKPRIRLVKGAYAEPIDKALHSKKEVDAQFRHLTNWLFEHGSLPAFGTHDLDCIEYAEKAAVRAGVGQKDFEIQMLYGIRRDLQESLVQKGYRVRVYIPYGSAWYPYLMRRMAERPSNMVFFLRSVVGS
jgi:proline dehydrogenase